MNIKNTWKKALLASIIVAFIYTAIITVTSSGGRMYFSPQDYKEVETMLYQEANDFLYEKSIKTTRWDSLKNAVQFKEFWLLTLESWLIYTLICFFACMLYLKLMQSNKSLKHGTPQSGAP